MGWHIHNNMNFAGSDAYGVDTDSHHWSDDFDPRRPARDAARAKFDEGIRDLLDEIADDNGLDSSEWGWEDYDYFRELMDL